MKILLVDANSKNTFGTLDMIPNVGDMGIVSINQKSKIYIMLVTDILFRTEENCVFVFIKKLPGPLFSNKIEICS